ncbi:hypothetical protein HK100_004441 [Physocladia obscura]|uniref:Short-chain dehydrogenase n=1 Tax=Physocladia obscura TaxID=109957 RepID=A0AAD5XCL5_9FUNG|nr:hypothetical protein HK100_004441 [Physocladia obscura]
MSGIAFTPSSTGDDVRNVFTNACIGKTFLVTGASTGIGLETARVLVSGNASHVIITGLTEQEGQDAIAAIKTASGNDNPPLTYYILNLGSTESRHEVAAKILNKFGHIDCLINNAGVLNPGPRKTTKDGLEISFGVNHLGTFHFTNQLLPLLRKNATQTNPSRIVNVASAGQCYFAPHEGIPFDNLNAEKKYNGWSCYGTSKLGVVLFTRELQRRESANNIVCVAVHPGNVGGTNIATGMGLSQQLAMMALVVRNQTVSQFLKDTKLKTVIEGCATSLFCALSPSIVGGGFYHDCTLSKGELLHKKAGDVEMGLKLWEVTEKLISGLDSKQ